MARKSKKGSSKASMNSLQDGAILNDTIGADIDIPKLPKTPKQPIQTKAKKPTKPLTTKPSTKTGKTTVPTTPKSTKQTAQKSSKVRQRKTSAPSYKKTRTTVSLPSTPNPRTPMTPEQRRERRRQQYRNRIESMTPDELANYRERNNERARQRREQRRLEEATRRAQENAQQIPDGFIPIDNGLDTIDDFFDDIPTFSPIESVRQRIEQMTYALASERTILSNITRKSYPFDVQDFERYKGKLLQIFDDQRAYLGDEEYGDYIINNYDVIGENIYGMEYASTQEIIERSFSSLAMILNGGALSALEASQLEDEFNISL